MLSLSHGLYLQNIRSLRKNIDELQTLLKLMTSRTKTWLLDNHTNHLFNTDGCNEQLTCNVHQKRGGVPIISKKKVVTGLHKKTQINNIQVSTAKVSGAVATYVMVLTCNLMPL